MRSISRTDANPIAQAMEFALIARVSLLRLSSLNVLESANPLTGRAGSRITQAANTGPANGPLPDSSTPPTQLSSFASIPNDPDFAYAETFRRQSYSGVLVRMVHISSA